MDLNLFFFFLLKCPKFLISVEELFLFPSNLTATPMLFPLYLSFCKGDVYSAGFQNKARGHLFLSPINFLLYR